MAFLPPGVKPTKVYNRIEAILAHTSRYAFMGRARLAHDVGVSRSTITRLLKGCCAPSFTLVSAITRVLEKHLKRPLDPRELVSLDGSYPTPSVCDLCGCPGCLPDAAYDGEENLKEAFRNVRPGHWSPPDAHPGKKEGR